MNWKLIFQLSVFGLVMGVATVFVIPSTVEPAFWLVVFVISAYAIARYSAAAPFLSGVAVGLANSVWVTAAHVLLASQYIPRHVREVQMMSSWPLSTHPRLLMLLTGPVIGLISGVILGCFALAAARIVMPEGRRATLRPG
jgi:hypothetical protein